MTVPGPVGGLERVVRSLACGHAALGDDIHLAAVLTEDDGSDRLLDVLAASGVTCHPLRLRRRAYLQERREVAAVLRKVQPDVVHTHGDRADVLDAPVARRLGIPTVTTVHGPSLPDVKGRLYEWLQRRSFRRFDAVVAVSQALAERSVRQGVAPDRVTVIPNAWAGGVDFLDRDAARRTMGLPLDRYVAGWVGRLIGIKGPDVFVDAIGLLRDLPIHGVMIGDGMEKDVIKRKVRGMGLENRIHLVGSILEMAPLFKAFDAFVLSSRSEGVPIVLFEAMDAGVPVVAARVGGVGEVLDRDTGILVPPEDPAALAEGMRSAYANPPAARMRATKARARLREQFAFNPWLERYAEVYRAAIARSRV